MITMLVEKRMTLPVSRLSYPRSRSSYPVLLIPFSLSRSPNPVLISFAFVIMRRKGFPNFDSFNSRKHVLSRFICGITARNVIHTQFIRNLLRTLTISWIKSLVRVLTYTQLVGLSTANIPILSEMFIVVP